MSFVKRAKSCHYRLPFKAKKAGNFRYQPSLKSIRRSTKTANLLTMKPIEANYIMEINKNNDLADKQYFVYLHLKPTDETDLLSSIFYVGKGTKERTKLVHRTHNPHHVNVVRKYSAKNIIIKKMLCNSEQHALDIEVEIIAKLRSMGVDICNVTDGGDGTSGVIPTFEQRKAQSERLRQWYKDNPDVAKANGEKTRERFANDVDFRRRFSESQKKAKNDPCYKLKASKKTSLFFKENPDARIAASKKTKEFFAKNPDAKKAAAERAKERMSTPESRKENSLKLKRFYQENPERAIKAGRELAKFNRENKTKEQEARRIENSRKSRGTKESRLKSSIASKIIWQKRREEKANFSNQLSIF